MASVTRISQLPDRASRSDIRRERVSIDLRGHCQTLNAIALSRQMAVAALVRTVLAEWLEARPVADAGMCAADVVRAAPVRSKEEDAVIKVTLRMPARHATRLARAARAAELSQGLYVARLIDAQPPVPAAPDQRENRAVLARSTSTVAAMSSDLQALMRILRQTSVPEPGARLATLAQLADALQQHLAAAAPLMAALTPSHVPLQVALPDGETVSRPARSYTRQATGELFFADAQMQAVDGAVQFDPIALEAERVPAGVDFAHQFPRAFQRIGR